MSEIFGKDALFSFVNEHYGIEPDYPFSDDASAVLRHPENRKWFALVMRVSKSKFGIKSDNAVDILNLKSDPILIGSLRLKDGFFPAYHMNKENWITAVLDGSAPDAQIQTLLAMSYDMTAPGRGRTTKKRNKNQAAAGHLR